jgi:hypothetical protein
MFKNGHASVADAEHLCHQWLRSQPKTFYYDGIKQLVGRWEKCVEKQGDYVEKLCILFL